MFISKVLALEFTSIVFTIGVIVANHIKTGVNEIRLPIRYDPSKKFA
jgi:hypothetical protein